MQVLASQLHFLANRNDCSVIILASQLHKDRATRWPYCRFAVLCQSPIILVDIDPATSYTPYTYHTFHGFLTALSTEMSRWASQLRGRIGTVVTFETSRRIRLSRAHQGICVLVEYGCCFRRKAALFKSSTCLSVGGLSVEKYHTVISFHIRTGFCASMRLDLPNQLVKFNKNYNRSVANV